MTTYVDPKVNTQYITYICLSSQANPNIFQANPTIAAGDFKIATDDAAPANLGTLPVVDADFTKRVKVTISTGEMNGANATLIWSDVAGDEWCDGALNLQTVTKQNDDLATPANVNAEVLDVLTVDTFAEVSSVPAGTSTIKDKINWLFGLGRNKITQTATTQTLRNDADSGNIATSTDSDNGTTYTRGEWS